MDYKQLAIAYNLKISRAKQEVSNDELDEQCKLEIEKFKANCEFPYLISEPPYHDEVRKIIRKYRRKKNDYRDKLFEEIRSIQNDFKNELIKISYFYNINCDCAEEIYKKAYNNVDDYMFEHSYGDINRDDKGINFVDVVDEFIKIEDFVESLGLHK